MKVKTLSLIPIVVLAFVSSNGFASPPGKTVEFPDGSAGKVIFSGSVHAEKGLKFMNCHPKIFPMKKTTEELKMSDLNAGKYCGERHNGKRLSVQTIPLIVQNAIRNKRAMRSAEIDGAMMKQSFENTRAGSKYD